MYTVWATIKSEPDERLWEQLGIYAVAKNNYRQSQFKVPDAGSICSARDI